MKRSSRRKLLGVAVVVMGAAAFVGVGVGVGSAQASSTAGLEVESNAPGGVAIEPVAIGQMPLAVHRRAARWLEARRQTSDSVWFDARLAGHATPLYRPGIEGVAYWEVPVLDAGGGALGWIVLATGGHDFPVVGSAAGGEPPSVQLTRMAAASGQRVTRVFMPSPFAFVAENMRGVEVARIGSLPPRILGADRAVLDLPSAERQARSEIAADGARVEEIGAAAKGVSYGSWASWAEYRAAVEGRGTLESEVLRRNAAPFWKLEASVERDATRIDPLEVVRVPLLARGVARGAARGVARGAARVEVRGAGAKHVALERGRGAGGDEWIDLRVKSSERSVSDLEVEISYASGERERLGFVVPAAVSAAPLPVSVLGQAFPATCKRVALRTNKGYYVRIVEGGKGKVDARAQRVGPWETLTLEPQSDGTVAFRQSASGAYLAADGGGGKKAVAVAGAIGPWEKFKPIASTGGTHAFKAGSNHHLVAEGGGNGDVNVNRPTVSTWERFHVICNPPLPQTYFADSASEQTAWARQRKYDQLDGKQSPNTSQCSSGCGATAWAMLIGNMDYAATQGVARYTPYRRAYLSNGGRGKLASDTVAPEFLDYGTKRITIELRNAMNDWGVSGCAPNGARFTSPTIMAQATSYFWGRIPARVRAEYDAFFVSTATGVNKVRHSLQTERKNIAIGLHDHYPVAWGIRRVTAPRWDLAQKKWVDYGSVEWMVDANWGWGEKFSRSVPLYSWFYGTIDTAPYSRVTQITNGCKLRATGGGPTGRYDRDYKCDPHLKNSERHVGMEAAERLIERDVLAGARAKNHKVCLLNSTDIQCAPCNTTDRLIVRMDVRPKTQACPAGTVNELR